MSKTRLISLPCKIGQGVVSDERAFELETADGEIHSSVAPVYYFWNSSGQPLAANEPTGDKEITGRIAARVVDRRNGTVFVSIPDGAVVPVAANTIADRPTEVVIHVPVGP